MKRVILFASKYLIENYLSTRGYDIFDCLVNALIEELGKKQVKVVNKDNASITIDVPGDIDSDALKNFTYKTINVNDDEFKEIKLSIFNVSEDEKSTSLKDENRKKNGKKFSEYVCIVEELQDYLTTIVCGQNHAIKELSSALLTARANGENNADYPLSVITLVGPNGVGKTLMANETAKFLGDKLGQKYLILNKKDYESESITDDVISFVYKNPFGIVVFNDAENFYKNIDLMLDEIFITGEVRKTSFKNCTLIFTTCICDSIYSKSLTGNLSHISQKNIATALTNDDRIHPLVVSGLNKGKLIMFNYLEPIIVKELAAIEIEKTFNNFTQKTNIDVQYNINELSSLIMYMNDKDYDIKSISQFIKEFVNKEFSDLFLQTNPNNQKPLLKTLKTIEYSIDFSGLSKSVEALFEDKDREFLVICDSNDVEFYKSLNVPHLSLLIATNTNEAKEFLRRDVECILIDVSLNTKQMEVTPTSLEDYDAEGVELFNYITTYYNEIPVYVTSNVNDNYSYSRYYYFLNGIARDVIYVDTSNSEDMAESLQIIQYGVELDSNIANLIEGQKRLSYNARQILSKDGKTVLIELYNLSLEYCQRDNFKKSFKGYADKVKFDDIIGNENAKKVLKAYSKLLTGAEFNRNALVKRSKGILLCGASGTGKTMLAKAVAHETNSALINQNLADLLCADNFTTAINNLFKQAKNSSPSVLLLEEIDEIFENCSDLEIKEFFKEMNKLNADERHPVLLIATTSCYKDDFTDNVIKQFDRVVELFIPNEKEREEFIVNYLLSYGIKTISKEIIHNFAIRSYGETYSYMKTILDFTIKNSHDMEITDETLINAIDLYNSGEETVVVSQESLENTAYHEIGHYLVDYLNGNHPPFVTIVSRGYYGGYTSSDLHENEEKNARQDYLNYICCCFGGRAAEIVINGEKGITSGLGSDIVSATKIARKMICELGMGKFLYAMRGIPNEDIPAPMLEEMDRVLHEQNDRAIKMLQDNKNLLIFLAKELVKKKSLTGIEIERLIKKFNENVN